MVQLKLLDLMIRNQSEAVPMGAKARADLIDLMARILVVIFQRRIISGLTAGAVK